MSTLVVANGAGPVSVSESISSSLSTINGISRAVSLVVISCIGSHDGAVFVVGRSKSSSKSMVVPKSSSPDNDEGELGRRISGPFPLPLPVLLMFDVRLETVDPFADVEVVFALLAGPGGLKGKFFLNALADEADVLREGGMIRSSSVE